MLGRPWPSSRDYKPNNGPEHRNERLHHEPDLQAERAEAAKASIESRRPLRGKVWVLFPGRSERRESELCQSGATTTADWAEQVIAKLREVEEACNGFWAACETGADRGDMEEQVDQAYQRPKEEAWDAIDGFTSRAATALESRSRFRRSS